MKIKTLIATLILSLTTTFAAAEASKPLATIEVKATKPLNEQSELKKFYNLEALKPDSAIAELLKDLKAENHAYTIEDKIVDSDIFVLESGQGGGQISTQYLIAIRGGFKSSTSVLKYLQASTVLSPDERLLNVTIQSPVTVTIEE